MLGVAVPMASAAQPKLQIGKLSLEDAERLASSFRPAWELDDAPFAPSNGAGIAAADLDALANGAGVTPSIRGTREKQPELLEAKTEIQPAPRVPALHEPKVEIAVDLDVEPDPTPPPVAEARPQTKTIPPVARQSYQPPKAPPKAIRMPRDPGASADYAPVKKSNMGLVLAVVGIVVVIGGIFAIRSAMSGDKASTATTATTSSPTHEDKVIPPPPPDTATQQVTQPAQTAAVKTADPVQQQTAPVQTQVAVAPTHTAAVTTNITAPVHTAAGGGGHTVAAGGGGHTAAAGGGHKTTIVRDNPFEFRPDFLIVRRSHETVLQASAAGASGCP